MALKAFCTAFFIMIVTSTGVSSRKFANTLTVTNANDWGVWGLPQYCGENTYAVGYNMKIEDPQGGTVDDTALNGIKLVCQSPSANSSGISEATSSVGAWGTWVGEAHCDDRGGKQHFLTAFQLQSESKQGGGDDTSANYVKFKCQPLDGSLPSYEMSKDPGSGKWGTYGHWSSDCPMNTAICGLRTRVEVPQGNGDDTALNDVQFYCCY